MILKNKTKFLARLIFHIGKKLEQSLSVLEVK